MPALLLLLALFSGVALADGPGRSEGKEIWRLFIDSSSVSQPAMGNDGTFYVTSSNGLYAVTPNGSIKWHTEVGGVLTSPALGGGIYVAGTGDQGQLTLYSVNENGVIVWRFPMSWPAWMGSYPPAVVPNSGIVAQAAGPYLFAVAADGSERWRFQLEDPIGASGPPAIGGGVARMIYVPSRYVYAIRFDGSEYWRFSPSPGWTGAFRSVIVGANETIFATADDGAIYAIGADGLLKWRFATDEWMGGAPALGPDGALYTVSDHGLFAINSDGTERWRLDLSDCYGIAPDLYGSAPAVGRDGVVYVSSGSCIYAINPTGIRRWASALYPYGARVGPSILGAGVLYAGRGDGYLSAIGISSSGFALSPWPMWRSDVRQTGSAFTHKIVGDGPCPTTRALSVDKTIGLSEKRAILGEMRIFRDSVLEASPKGQQWLGVYRRHLPEIDRIMAASPVLAARCAKVLASTWPDIAAANRNGGSLELSRRNVAEIRSIVAEYRRHASPALATSLRELDLYLGSHSRGDGRGPVLIPSP
jgi:outer membrane protein assembly factor BamB